MLQGLVLSKMNSANDGRCLTKTLCGRLLKQLIDRETHLSNSSKAIGLIAFCTGYENVVDLLVYTCSFPVVLDLYTYMEVKLVFTKCFLSQVQILNLN
jgi:hypothetical protein